MFSLFSGGVRSTFTSFTSATLKNPDHVRECPIDSNPLTPSGISNSSVSCYRNAVIQALSSLPPHLLPDSVRFFAIKINEGSSNALHLPRHLQLLGAGQQDAHEYFLTLVSQHSRSVVGGRVGMEGFALFTSTSRPLSSSTAESPSSTSTNIQQLLNEISNDLSRIIPINSSHLFARPPLPPTKRHSFEGLCSSTLVCSCCFSAHIQLEKSVGISLVVPERNVSLQDLLSCSHDLIENYHCESCSLSTHRLRLKQKSLRLSRALEFLQHQLSVHHGLQSACDDTKNPDFAETQQQASSLRLNIRTAISRIIELHLRSRSTSKCAKVYTRAWKSNPSLVRAPLLLSIHLSRLNHHKNTHSVTFNHELHIQLHLSSSLDFHHEKANPVAYALKSVIVHYGSSCGGHYICFREWRGNWFGASDGSVRPVSFEHVMRHSDSVTQLFYERIVSRPPLS